MRTTQDIVDAIDGSQDEAVGHIVVAALARMGRMGEAAATGVIDLVETLADGNDAEQDRRGDIGEAIGWLAEEVSDSCFA